jgi:hypothetical protein
MGQDREDSTITVSPRRIRAATSLRQRLAALTPLQFENLTFDLLIRAGWRNVVWRTPGADGGRDIEADAVFVDPSEHLTSEHWYIECKHYSSSIDWPTLHPKLAYAINHEADFLLLVTTATLSPRCAEEVALHEQRKAPPRIRVWDGPHLEHLVPRYPLVMVKFGLSTTPNTDAAMGLLPFVLEVSKVVQSAYGNAIVRDASDSSLELCAALLELASARLEHPEHWQVQHHRFLRRRDLYPWCDAPATFDGGPYYSYGLRAILAASKFLSQSARIRITPSKVSTHLVVAPGGPWVKSETSNRLLQLIALWGNLDVHFVRESVIVAPRKG